MTIQREGSVRLSGERWVSRSRVRQTGARGRRFQEEPLGTLCQALKPDISTRAPLYQLPFFCFSLLALAPLVLHAL